MLIENKVMKSWNRFGAGKDMLRAVNTDFWNAVIVEISLDREIDFNVEDK